MKVTDAFWFTQIGQPSLIGIVIGRDEITQEKKAYIGTAVGLDECLDAERIAEGGAKLRLQTAKEIVAALSD
jgi:hypothetical protein